MCYNNPMNRTRKLVYDIGINDMPEGYCTGPEKPIYDRWAHVLYRAGGGEDGAFYKKHPTYVGTTVCEEWLTLSNFVAWVKSHENWQGKHIDKDILCPGNKHYSPETCVLVSHDLNNLLCDSAARRGECPKGVNEYTTPSGIKRYRARLSTIVNGSVKRISLGVRATQKEAHRAYCNAKEEYIREIAENLTDADTCDIERTREALLKHAVIEGNLWRETEDSADSVPTLFG